MSLLSERIAKKESQLLQLFENKFVAEKTVEACELEIERQRAGLIELAGASEILDNIEKKKEEPPKGDDEPEE